MLESRANREKAACHYMVILKGKEMLQVGREKGSTPTEKQDKRDSTVQEKGCQHNPYLGLLRG